MWNMWKIKQTMHSQCTKKCKQCEKLRKYAGEKIDSHNGTTLLIG